jgi:hypothetical protein
MKATQIVIGHCYAAKVSGRVVAARVIGTEELTTRTGWRTAWRCVNEQTGRLVCVRSAQRFRYPIAPEWQTVERSVQPFFRRSTA